MTSQKSVAILLCTFNGGQYLKGQIDSLLSQTYTNWKIWASDDGSSDDTLKILRIYQEKIGIDKMQILEGPRLSFSDNFISLIKNRKITADFYAFCDQDDEWFTNKLDKSIEALSRNEQNLPALYGSRTIYVDRHGYRIGESMQPRRPLSLNNALVQSIIGGNTMMINNKLRDYLCHANLKQVQSHDWAIYLLVSALGGKIYFSNDPTVYYRQHDSNIVGQNIKILAKLKRFKYLYQGKFWAWVAANIEFIEVFEGQISKDNLNKIMKLKKILSEKSFSKKFFSFYKMGLYRQSKFQTFILQLFIYKA